MSDSTTVAPALHCAHSTPCGPMPGVYRVAFWTAMVVIGAGLLGCGATPVTHTVVYDFGPATDYVSPNGSVTRSLPPVILADVEAPPALDGTALLYRLSYSNAQQLRPYAQARWSMPPAFLLRQRLRQQLGAQRTVGVAADAGAARLPLLRVELEEFSQLFDTPSHCQAVVRIRATLSQAPLFGVPAGPFPNQLAVPSVPGLIAQTALTQQQTCATPDAVGGARALAQASVQVSVALDDWLAHSLPAPTP